MPLPPLSSTSTPFFPGTIVLLRSAFKHRNSENWNRCSYCPYPKKREDMERQVLHDRLYNMENGTKPSRKWKRTNIVTSFLVKMLLLYVVFVHILGSSWFVRKASRQQISSTLSRKVLPTRKTSLSETPVVLIIVKLSAEMGNQLHRIANGQCVKHLVEERFGLQTKFFIIPDRWKDVEATRQAFPNVHLHIPAKETAEDLENAHQLQSAWINGLLANSGLNLTNVRVPTILSERFCGRDECYADLLNLLNQTLHMHSRPIAPVGGTNTTLPLVYVDKFLGSLCWHLMFDKFKDFFKLDEDAICNQVPDPDESVFHFRNYRAELSRKSVLEHAFEEVDPKMAAEVLFADSKPGDKVAIVSRFQKYTDGYIKAFRKKGMKARYIKGQTGVQDFCFLYKAEKELVISARSTFGRWAAFFGQAKRVRLYSLSTNASRARGVDVRHNPFGIKELQDRLLYENYNTTW
eukprot:scaffold2391_cov113-Cylindrotheca_fusiformis.AAC.1